MRSEPAEDAVAAAAMATSSETTELGGCWEQHEGSDEPFQGGRRSRSARRCRPVTIVAPELDLTDSSSVSYQICNKLAYVYGAWPTSRRVSGSIPGDVAGDFFQNYRLNRVLESTQPLKMSIRKTPVGEDGRCVRVTTLPPS
jgi:hypothetical protein